MGKQDCWRQALARFGLNSKFGFVHDRSQGEMETMGRLPRSKKRTVEESLTLRIGDLGLPGALDHKNLSGSLSWTLPLEKTFGVSYKLDYGFRMNESGLVLRLIPDAALGRTLPGAQEISIKDAKCNFGGQQFWFLCPGLWVKFFGDPYHKSCGRGRADLYLPDGAVAFACRGCHNLTYESTQKHDQRIDRLLRNPDLITYLRGSWNDPEHLLAVKAADQQVSRMNRRKRPN
jgi:hypothetical protein